MSASNRTAKVFAESLGRLRTRRGWTQKRLAAESGVSACTISLIECGKAGPGLTTAAALADALDASLDEMTGRTARDGRKPGTETGRSQ